MFLDFVKLELEQSRQATKTYKAVIQKDTLYKNKIFLLEKIVKEAINKFFWQVKKDAAVTSDFKDWFDWKKKSKQQQNPKT